MPEVLNVAILRQFIERIENLEDKKTEIQNERKCIVADAKSQGLDPKIMEKIIQMRKMKKDELVEQQVLLDMYMQALGMKL